MTFHFSIQSVERPVSRLIMGTGFWRRLEQREANEIFDAFVEKGGNCFDTAVHYGDNEDLLGNWMRARNNREELVVHAKGAHHKIIHPRGAPFEYHCPRVDPEEIKNDLRETLRRLQTDAIDVFALHRDNPDQPVGPIIECLAAEQKAGRIRAFGASNWTIPRIEEANAYAAAHRLPGFVSNSPNLALAFPNEPSWPNCVTACDRFSREWHANRGMPLLGWSCLAQGFFNGQFRPLETLSEKQLKKLMSDRWIANVVRVYYSKRNFDRLRRVQQLADELGVTPTQLALAWVLHQGDHVFAIAGPGTPRETQELFEAFKINLAPDQLSWLNLEPGKCDL
jgi:aryl-alcohol dehydrogenase-like predicted oxidoreductase